MVRALMQNGFDSSVHNPHSKSDETLQDLICFGSTEVTKKSLYVDLVNELYNFIETLTYHYVYLCLLHNSTLFSFISNALTNKNVRFVNNIESYRQ